jgi:DNA-binding GntR family transcriptional regulator
MPRIENRILTEHVYDVIKQMIEEGALAPGAKVSKKELEDTLGVSQTPINEALSRLAGEQYLYQESRRGYFVKLYTDRELIDLYAVRAAIEGMAARLCAEEATDEELSNIGGFFQEVTFPMSSRAHARYQEEDSAFHAAVVRYSHNDAIQELSRKHGYIIKSYQRGLLRPPEETYPEHQEMLAAITSRDGAGAQSLMADHLLKSREALKAAASAQ